MKLSELHEGDYFVSAHKNTGFIFKVMEEPRPGKKTVRCKNLSRPKLNPLSKLASLEVSTTIRCENCSGSGEASLLVSCEDCEGTGRIDLKTL